MPVTPDEVRRVAALARIPLDDGEAAALAGELDSILGHMEALRRVDAADAVPLPGTAGQAAPLRPDASTPDLMRRTPDMLAPVWEDPFFVVPRHPVLDPDAGPEGGAP